MPADISSARNYRRIDERLITAGQPDEAQLASCATGGTHVVINLALHDDPRYSLPDERATVESHGMKYIHIPVQFSTPAEVDLESFFDAMDEHAGRNVLVHCAANYRVAVFLALYRVVRQGWPEEAAFEQMRIVWEPDKVWSGFIDTVLTRPVSRSMHPRAVELINSLGLSPHREGGHFREIHRSAAIVAPGDGRSTRSSLTVIYFLLAAGEVSRWHRVASDESWHFHEGDAIDVLMMDDAFTSVSTSRLGPWAPPAEPVHVVPAGAWQAARCAGDYALVSCAVAPGFDFADFKMLRARPDDAATFRRKHPRLADFI